LSEYERQQLLRSLSSPPPGGTLLFAVSGGMYAEGVDYPGSSLGRVRRLPALPQVSFQAGLLRRYFDRRDESGFDFAYCNLADARRPGRPAHPQQDRPRRDRPALRAIPRGSRARAGFRATGTAGRRRSSRRGVQPTRSASSSRNMVERTALSFRSHAESLRELRMPRLTVDAWIRPAGPGPAD
jgi:hypothetical protein